MSRALALCFAASLTLGCGTLIGGSDEPVAARMGGEVITIADVDATIEQQLYELRSEALERLLTQRAVEQRAAHEGSTADALLEQVGQGISDEEIAAFFAQREKSIRAQIPDATLESVTPQIRSILETERKRDFVRSVREQASYRVELEAPRVEMSVEGSPSLGRDDAPVTIVEFSDFQCPYCRRAGPVMKELVAKYPEDVRVVYRHLPLAMHARARHSAEASACADEQGRFWEYHDVVFENPGALGDEDLVRYAEELGLDRAKFEDCYKSGRYAEQVRADALAAEAVGITGTPGFVLNGIVVRGFKSVAEFEKLIDDELDRAAPSDEAGAEG